MPKTASPLRLARVVAVAGALVWLAALGAAPLVAARQHDAPRWQRQSAAVVYLAASVICHQRPDRSYNLADAPLPVCARCLGLHAGAALGLLGALFAGSAARARLLATARPALMAAVLPTALSLGVEWAGGGSPALARTLTALPAGAMAGALVAATVCYTTWNVAASTDRSVQSV